MNGLKRHSDRHAYVRSPANPAQPRNTAIDNVYGQSFRGERALKFRRKRVTGRKSKAGGERIAEGHDRQRALGRARARKHRDGSGRTKHCDSGVPPAYLQREGQFPI